MPLYPSKKKNKVEEDAELNITSLMDAFTIILIFLLKSYGSSVIDVADGYRAPTAETRLEVDRIIALQVREGGRDAIYFRIGDREEKAERLDPNLGYQMLLADLKTEKRLSDATISEEELKGAINIVANPNVTYGTILKVMQSSASAGFFKLKLIAQP